MSPDPRAPRIPSEIELDLQPSRLAGLHHHHPNPRHRLLATHGWLDNAASFNRLMPALDRDEAVVLDMPGHGHSQWYPPGFIYHLMDTVVAFVDALELLGWERCVLVGHSLGACVLPLMAAVVPEKVAGMVLLDGLGPMGTSPAEAPRVLREAVQDRHKNRNPRLYSEREQAIQRLLKRDLTREAAEVLAGRGLNQVAGGWKFGHDPRLTWTSRLRLSEPQVWAFLEAVVCPVLLVVASRSPMHEQAGFAQRLERVPHFRRLDVEGGHHVHLEQPELVLPAIQDFLQEIE